MAKDYDREEINREIARSRPSAHPRCAALRDLGNYKVADGYPDPQSGQCTHISAAYNITAVKAMIIHPAKMAENR